MNWALTAASLAGVLALAALAWWLRLGREEPLGEEEVRGRVAFEFAPAHVTCTILGADGRSAVACLDDGRLVAVKVHGTQPATRLLAKPLRIDEQANAVTIHTGDRWFGALVLILAPSQRDRLRAML